MDVQMVICLCQWLYQVVFVPASVFEVVQLFQYGVVGVLLAVPVQVAVLVQMMKKMMMMMTLTLVLVLGC